jgi:hypothetical protein
MSSARSNDNRALTAAVGRRRGVEGRPRPTLAVRERPRFDHGPLSRRTQTAKRVGASRDAVKWAVCNPAKREFRTPISGGSTHPEPTRTRAARGASA